MTSGFAPTRVQLDNGLVVMHQSNLASSAVTVSLSVAAGACFESAGQAGLATLVARGLTRGTELRDKAAVGEVLDFQGAHLGGTAGRHTAGLVAKSRADDMPEIVELLAECARRPSFPDAEVSKLVGDRLTALREDLDDPAIVAMHSLRELVYPEQHPYAARVRGTPATVEAIRADDLREFHARFFGPSAALLIVAGNVDADTAVAIVQGAFEGWADQESRGGYRLAQCAVGDVAPPHEVQRRVESMPDKAQVDIALGHASIRRTDERYYAASLMNTILGRFAMGGRLGRSVREEQGMAYYTYSAFGGGLGPGPFVVRAGVQPQHVEAAVEAVLAEIRRIRTEPVTADELDNAKAATIRALPRALESNEGAAGLLHEIEMFDLGLDYLEQLEGLIGGVDAEAVQEAARDLLCPDAYALSIAGPWAPSTGGS
ncbi:MAG TPA: pitrilysin family protein [Acidobacteriota bacterium]|nr:pitrilysin family protein [Acidobacteriota bacterium]